MACILIDYENQRETMLEGISTIELSERDELVFFYTRNAGKISLRVVEELNEVPAKKTYIRVQEGKNALDFQLSSYLGARIQENPKNSYYILSKDLGYEVVCTFWRNRNVFVKRLDRFFSLAI